ncbi:hypothetical protein HPB51_024446 [Rhipicephalus microplus]|uniref:DDE Tnp4 domain-containing protein n=1 Tax=Rhipicephalus microplus TaxID=6941 RepID=A0A9J6D7M9_RHIMP|nr:hypothetical protein HPB51_024446 [Rhipicephalus microplus]
MSKRRRLMKAEETSVLLLQQLADECLDTSSSDDDDDDHQIFASKFTELFAKPIVVPKVRGYVRNVVSIYSDKQFRTNFRLARSACYELIKQFEASEFYPSDRNHGGVPVKTPEENILSFLWYAVNKASMKEVAVLFDMAESTQFAVTDRFLGFLCKIAPDVIHFRLDKDAVARDFEKFTKEDKITQLLIACCVLHNICLDSGDTGVKDLLTEEERKEIRQDALLQIREECAELDQNRQPQTDRESVLRRLGELKRNALMQQL